MFRHTTRRASLSPRAIPVHRAGDDLRFRGSDTGDGADGFLSVCRVPRGEGDAGPRRRSRLPSSRISGLWWSSPDTTVLAGPSSFAIGR